MYGGRNCGPSVRFFPRVTWPGGTGGAGNAPGITRGNRGYLHTCTLEANFNSSRMTTRLFFFVPVVWSSWDTSNVPFSRCFWYRYFCWDAQSRNDNQVVYHSTPSRTIPSEVPPPSQWPPRSALARSSGDPCDRRDTEPSDCLDGYSGAREESRAVAAKVRDAE